MRKILFLILILVFVAAACNNINSTENVDSFDATYQYKWDCGYPYKTIDGIYKYGCGWGYFKK